jgi:hypothetical protein
MAKVPVEKFRKFLDVNGLDSYEGCSIKVDEVDEDGVEYCTEDEALKVLGFWNLAYFLIKGNTVKEKD